VVASTQAPTRTDNKQTPELWQPSQVKSSQVKSSQVNQACSSDSRGSFLFFSLSLSLSLTHTHTHTHTHSTMPVRRSKTLAKVRAGEPVKVCALGHFMPFFVHVSDCTSHPPPPLPSALLDTNVFSDCALQREERKNHQWLCLALTVLRCSRGRHPPPLCTCAGH
jgi:hypothetical protein